MADKLLSALKRTLITINFFYVITGVIILSQGIYAQVQMDTFSVLWWGYYVAWYAIGVGLFILVSAAFGFYGAIRENHLLNVMFAAVMVLTFILQLSGSIAGVANKDFALHNVKVQLPYTIKLYGNFDDEIRIQWDTMQERFQCCGVANATDWLTILRTEDTLRVPISCCPKLNSFEMPTAISKCNIDNAYTRGCGEVFYNFANSQMDSIWITGAFLTLMQGLITVSVINALWMVKVAREEKNNTNQN